MPFQDAVFGANRRYSFAPQAAEKAGDEASLGRSHCSYRYVTLKTVSSPTGSDVTDRAILAASLRPASRRLAATRETTQSEAARQSPPGEL